MATAETDGPFDLLNVQLRDASGQLLETLATISDRSQSGTWVQSNFNLGAYAGQTLQVAFVATTDDGVNTNFFVDDVSLIGCSAEITPTPVPPSTPQPGVVRVYTSPPNASVGVGRTTQVEVRVDAVTDLYGYELHLSFDPVKVQVDGSPQPGDVFAGKAVQTFQTAVDNTAGTVDYAVALQGAAGGVTGSGSLVRLTFRGVVQGNSPLTLRPTTSLADSLANVIPATLQSGSLTVTTASGRILGRVQLQGRTDFRGVTINVNGASATTDSAGDFTLSGVSGQVDVEARVPGYLFARRENVSVGSGDVTLPVVTLPGGDANQDGLVNVQDGVIVSRNFGGNVPAADARADINGDGRIGVQDGVLVSRNFSAAAPIPWPAVTANQDTAELEALARAALGLRPASRHTTTRAVAGATLRFDPSPLFMPVNGVAGIDVRVAGAADLYGFELHFTFDPSQLQVEGELQPGTLFAGRNTQVFQSFVDNTTGRIDYAASLQGATSGVSGTGTLVRLTLRGISEGSSGLVFTPATSLSDSQARLLPVTLESGGVTVGTGGIATPTATPIPIPTATPPPGVSGIYGRVTVLATPAAGISVGLYHYDGSDLTATATTLTDAAGRYQFITAPALPADHLYFTGFVNPTSDPRYLIAIIGPLIETYTPGMTVAGGDLEIADVALGEPDEERVAISYPVVFRWTARNIPGDWYYLHLFGADYIPDAGYTPDWVEPGGGSAGNYTLVRQPGGFESHKQYFWNLYVWHAGTLGLPLNTHRVVLAEPPASQPLYLPLILRNGSTITLGLQTRY
jgi:hypothetical protein